MMAESFWLNPWILLSATTAILGLVLLMRGMSARERYDLRRLQCPESGGTVETLLVRDSETGRFLAVDRCSAFGKPGRVACDRCCLDLLNRGFRLAADDSGP